MPATLAEGLEQTAGYAAQYGAAEMYLIIFDRNPSTDPDAKIWQAQENWQGRHIGVWGM